MQAADQSEGQWWSRRWRSLLGEVGIIDPVRSSAPQGIRVKSLEVTPGRIIARLQDRERGNCAAEIRIRQWTDEQWQRAITSLGDQALFLAQLLAGDFPPELEQSLSTAGVLLLPAQANEIDHECSCCDGRPEACEHLVAVYSMLGDMLSSDPWLLFRLRGRVQQQVLRALGRHRALSANIRSAAPPYSDEDGGNNGRNSFYRTGVDDDASGAIPTLEASIEQFWGSSRQQEDFHPRVVRPSIELALLRRLGPPPFSSAGPDTYDVLAAVYQSISQAAITLAYAADAAEPTDGQE